MFYAGSQERDMLDAMAQTLAATIAGDFPDVPTDYDLWVEYLGDTLVGVIDMGDAHHEVYEWDAQAQDWEMSPHRYSFDTVDEIIRKRESGW